MKTKNTIDIEKKFIGCTLIGLGMLSDSKEARIALTLLGVAVLLPKETLQLLDTIKKAVNQYSQLKPAPIIENKTKKKK